MTKTEKSRNGIYYFFNILLIIGWGSVTAIGAPYYIKFWQHVNLAILKNPYLVAL